MTISYKGIEIDTTGAHYHPTVGSGFSATARLKDGTIIAYTDYLGKRFESEKEALDAACELVDTIIN